MVAGTTALTTLTIPTTVTKINDGNSDNPGAFQGSGLKSIDLSNTALTKWKSGAGIGQDFGTFQGDAALTSVKLPLKLAQSGGIAQSAFNGCTTLNTIEFVLDNVADLSTLDTDANSTTALANIYKMFAAGDNSFGDNTQIGIESNAPAAAKWWLPANVGSPKFTKKTNTTAANFTSTINGIKWVATINPDDAATDDATAASAITSTTTQVTITGTVAPAGQALKYKHTNNGDTADVNLTGDTDSQALPSNIKTIKITLKKAK